MTNPIKTIMVSIENVLPTRIKVSNNDKQPEQASDSMNPLIPCV